MTNFIQLDLPEFDFSTPLTQLVDSGVLSWHNNEICITTVPEEPNNYHLGVGSLLYEWSNSGTKDSQGNVKYAPVLKENPLTESQFTKVCDIFSYTIFEQVYKTLSETYNIGRLRFIRMKPKTCYSWHTDWNKRIHYPIETSEGSMFVFENEVKALPAHTWWEIDTMKPHTVINASKETRIHLVGVVL